MVRLDAVDYRSGSRFTRSPRLNDIYSELMPSGGVPNRFRRAEPTNWRAAADIRPTILAQKIGDGVG